MVTFASKKDMQDAGSSGEIRVGYEIIRKTLMTKAPEESCLSCGQTVFPDPNLKCDVAQQKAVQHRSAGQAQQNGS